MKKGTRCLGLLYWSSWLQSDRDKYEKHHQIRIISFTILNLNFHKSYSYDKNDLQKRKILIIIMFQNNLELVVGTGQNKEIEKFLKIFRKKFLEVLERQN